MLVIVEKKKKREKEKKMTSTAYFDLRVHMDIRRDRHVKGKRNEEIELLASAARLRYVHQIAKARSEFKDFTSKLLLRLKTKKSLKTM